MTEMDTRDVEAMRRALDADGDEIHVSLSRSTAELLSEILDARARGRQILVTRANAEVTPTEAASLLGVSRPQVRKLMDQGRLEFRMVGTHHRIRVASVQAFLDAERPRRRSALADLAELQNELGLTE